MSDLVSERVSNVINESDVLFFSRKDEERRSCEERRKYVAGEKQKMLRLMSKSHKMLML